MEFKETRLCQDCFCILDVDREKLKENFKELKIYPLKNPVDLENALENGWTMIVEKVLTGEVCAFLCLEEKDKINSWHYLKHTQLCKCGWIDSNFCPERLVNTDLQSWSFQKNGLMSDDSPDAFVQLEKSVPCGKNAILQFKIRFTKILPKYLHIGDVEQKQIV